MDTLKNYKYELPESPLQIRKGVDCNGKQVGYFHILGMPDKHDKADLGYTEDATFVLVSDATKIGYFYPAMYDPKNDVWKIISQGIHYKDGQIIEYLPL